MEQFFLLMHKEIPPAISFANNGISYLFQNMAYKLNDVEIESFNLCGWATTMKGLLTKPKTFNALDQCWMPDTYDGKFNNLYTYYPIPLQGNWALPTVGVNPTTAEFQTGMALFIRLFNNANNTTVPTLTAGDFPCAGANPTVDEMVDGFHRICDEIDGVIDAPALPEVIATDFLNASSNSWRDGYNLQITKINNFLVKNNPNPIDYNTGIIGRQRRIFNNFDKVQPAANAGMFSFRIPLSFMFNFCENYNKVIYNCKHELTFTRDVDSNALFRSSDAV